jgi:2-methylisoborneol synthase
MARIGLVPGAGLGMAAARLSQAGRPARVTEALYCPPAVRDDPALAATVQQHLDEWAAGVGLAPGPAAGLGRLVVLAHPDTNDVGRLGVAARLLAVGRVLAGEALGARDADLLRRAPTDTAIDAAGSVTGNAESAAATVARDVSEASAATLAQALDEAIAEVYDGCDLPEAAPPSRPDPARAGIADPALASALAGLSALPSSPYQVERVRGEYESLSAAAPSAAGGGPRPPWEYLSLGHVNAYSPALAALDAVGGFQVSPSAAADPELRRAQRLASLAAALLHDIAEPSPSGLTAAIARADGLGPGAAGRRAAEVHDEAMRAFTHHAAQLAAGADPATRRYLSALWTWLGGHRTWHAVS